MGDADIAKIFTDNRIAQIKTRKISLCIFAIWGTINMLFYSGNNIMREKFW